ncbi:MAG: DEAD/DEAH box helicase [Actinomycetota bacterium]
MKRALIESFEAGYPFGFDPFQSEAIEALLFGESVLISAPTGSGKTVVGEFAVWLAVKEGGKAFYTTPLKALSNQKFGDLARIHGTDNVGLLTGDNAINPQAPVVVMTTEVLRNMIYERSELLDDLRFVVLDEVHYLQDRYRGAVWEEVIIHLPLDVKMVALSATLSNAEEFADWLRTIRGGTRVITESHRAVPLTHHYLVEGRLYPMFTGDPEEPELNPQIKMLETRPRWEQSGRRRQSHGIHGAGGHRSGPHGHRRRFPRRAELAELLEGAGMLPALYFIFSRKGCDAAVAQCLREGVVLTTPRERKQIMQIAEARCAYLDSADLDILGYDEWLVALANGVAAHHAGLIPVFKETVEELFKMGHVRLTFATETLSLGINMPARTVLIESLNKFTGERHELLTPGQFTQLTGRAGRRGIDVVGHAVVPQQPDVPFKQIAGLALTHTYPLISSFQPSYNMATNLVRNYSREEAEHLLNSSFAQYRTDKEVVVVEQLVDRNAAYLASYREKMQCSRGHFEQYWEIRERLGRLELSVKSREAENERTRVKRALASAAPGQVWAVRASRVNGPVVVIGTEESAKGERKMVTLTRTTRVVKLGVNELRAPPVMLGTVDLGKGTLGQLKHTSGTRLDHNLRRQLAASLRIYEEEGGVGAELEVELQLEDDEDIELQVVRTSLLQHPCHDCADRERHAQWAERATRLARENEQLHKRVQSKTETLSRKFEKILEVLEEYGYLADFNLTAKGNSLARIYNENDLLITECLARGWLDELGPAELASLLTVFVYESRGPVETVGTLPTAATKRAYGKIVRLEERMKRSEARAGLELIRGTQTGFVGPAHCWCRGDPLEDVIDEDSSPGDFIRSCKQTIDLLRQLRQAAADPSLVERLEDAVDGMNRGVVAYSGVSW